MRGSRLHAGSAAIDHVSMLSGFFGDHGFWEEAPQPPRCLTYAAWLDVISLDVVGVDSIQGLSRDTPRLAPTSWSLRTDATIRRRAVKAFAFAEDLEHAIVALPQLNLADWHDATRRAMDPSLPSVVAV